MKQVLLVLLIVNGLSVSLHAQEADMSEYHLKIEQYLSQSPSTDAATMSENMTFFWTSDKLTLDQKRIFIEIFDDIIKQRVAIRPHTINFLKMIYFAKERQDFDEVKMDDLMDYLQLLSANKNRELTYRHWAAGAILHESNLLFTSNANELVLSEGKIAYVNLVPEPVIEEEVEEEEEDSWDDDGWGNTGWDDDGWGNADNWFSDEEDESGEEWNTAEDVKAANEGMLEMTKRSLRSKNIIPTGLLIRIEDAELLISNRDGDFPIKDVKGYFSVDQGKFIAESGLFTWENTGKHPDSLYVRFDYFDIEVSKAEFNSANAILHYPEVLSDPIEGLFEFKVGSRINSEAANYPSFKSFSNQVKAEGIAGPDITFMGGFSLRGIKQGSESVVPGRSVIEMSYDGRRRFRATSDNFRFGDSLLTTNRAKILIDQDEDSITHPAVELKYRIADRHLTILKDKGIFKNTPFVASYHAMEINAELIEWNIPADSMEIQILVGRSQVPAVFESKDYFSRRRYSSLSGLYDFHPLQLSVMYGRKRKSDRFYVSEAAKDLKLKDNHIRGGVKTLRQDGYVAYDPLLDQVQINRKGYHYVDAAAKKVDYDDMLIPSVTEDRSNALLDFEKNELTVRGINQFFISEPLNVSIRPDSAEIRLVKDRNFFYSGITSAGNFNFYGKDYEFNYSDFSVRLGQIDSLQFIIEEVGADGKVRQVAIDNQLVDTRGIVFLNYVNNKSNTREFGYFPIFIAEEESFVYFDKKEILNGTYDRDIYHQIPPFEIDSLSVSDPGAFKFEGSFHSGGMFPVFDEFMGIIDNPVSKGKSMGFKHEIPEGGYPIFDETANLDGFISVSNDGIRVEGTIHHLSADISATDFVFYQDSVTSEKGTLFDSRAELIAGIEFPPIQAKEFSMLWVPEQDTMRITAIATPFNLYDNFARMKGSTVFTTGGVSGNGVLSTEGSQTKSHEYTFLKENYRARNAKFEIQSDDPRKPSLFAEDVKVDFNVNKRQAQLISEEEGRVVLSFPYSQMRTSINSASWDLDEQMVYMEKPKDVPLENSYFFTTRKALDSIAFNASRAEYDIRKLEMTVGGIPEILIADVKIIPGDSTLVVKENATFEKMTNARIFMDAEKQFHKLYQADITIESRHKFQGTATYLFVNAVQDTFEFAINRFIMPTREEDSGRRRPAKGLDSREFNHTVAVGEMLQEDEVLLSPGIYYKGDVVVHADKELMELKGFLKLDLQEVPYYDTWIRYESDAEDEEITFDFNTAKTENNETPRAGLFFDHQVHELYPVFMYFERSKNDQQFFKPSGMLTYNRFKDEYTIIDEDKNIRGAYKGKIFRYNENEKSIFFEGDVNFTNNKQNLGMDIKAAARGKGNYEKEEFELKSTLILDTDLHRSVAQLLAERLRDAVEDRGAPPATRDNTGLTYRIAELTSEEKAKEYEERSKMDYVSLSDFASEFVKTITISEVEMQWSNENKAWFSKSKIGIANIANMDINAALDGFIEFRKTERGDVINLYTQLGSTFWMFISYEENRMNIITSSDEVNQEIKKRSNISKARMNEFAFYQGEIADVMSFGNRFQSQYYKIDTPFRIGSGQVAPEQDTETFDTFEKQEEDDDDDDDGGF